MKKLLMALLAGAFIMAGPAAVLAQDDTAPPPRRGMRRHLERGERPHRPDGTPHGEKPRMKRGEHPYRPDGPPHGEPPQVNWRSRMKELDLTAEQKEQVKAILAEQRQAVKAWHEEHKEQVEKLHKQMRRALRDGNKEKIKYLRGKLKELGESRKALHESLMEKLSSVLNTEQMAKVRRFLRPRERHPWLMKRLGVLRRLKLTEDQHKQMRTILEAAREQTEQTENDEDKVKIMKEAWGKVVNEVLTDKQREKLQKFRDREGKGPIDFGDMPGLNLTDQQKAQIKEIIKSARAEAAEADSPEAKKEIHQTARKKIRTEVLTDEQRKKWDKWKRRHRDEKGPRRPGNRERDGGRKGPKRPPPPPDEAGDDAPL